jgi:hypothetical protein
VIEIGTFPSTAPIRRVNPGDTIDIELPYSEVCMHLRVAGQARTVRVTERAAEILDADGRPLTAPVLHAEAGIHRDDAGLFLHA